MLKVRKLNVMTMSQEKKCKIKKIKKSTVVWKKTQITYFSVKQKTSLISILKRNIGVKTSYNAQYVISSSGTCRTFPDIWTWSTRTQMKLSFNTNVEAVKKYWITKMNLINIPLIIINHTSHVEILQPTIVSTKNVDLSTQYYRMVRCSVLGVD